MPRWPKADDYQAPRIREETPLHAWLQTLSDAQLKELEGLLGATGKDSLRGLSEWLETHGAPEGLEW